MTTCTSIMYVYRAAHCTLDPDLILAARGQLDASVCAKPKPEMQNTGQRRRDDAIAIESESRRPLIQ